MTKSIAEILGKILDPVIIAGGIIVLMVMLFMLLPKLKALKASAEDQLLGIRGGAVINPKTLALKQRNTALASRESSYALREEFNKLISFYSTLARIIPLFPLLGILGTVAGLLVMVLNQTDISVIYSSLGSALSSTLWGLIAAIVLKIAETFTALKYLSEIDSVFERYDNMYQDAATQKDFAADDQL